MADSNPANFANLPKDELKEIAAKGGHASHGGQSETVQRPLWRFHSLHDSFLTPVTVSA